jgi:hypothetical protein
MIIVVSGLLLTDDGVVDLCVDADVLIDGGHLTDPDSDGDLLGHLHRQGHRVLNQKNEDISQGEMESKMLK